MKYNNHLAETTKLSTGLFQAGLALSILYIISLYNYLFFHTLAEIIIVIILIAIFTVAWNSRHYLDNHYYLFLGITFLFIGTLDLIHAFIFKGSGILTPGGNANSASQLWITGRSISSLSFLVAPLFIKRKLNYRLIFLIYTIITTFAFLSIFYWKNFPAAYIEGIGQTNFKIYSEYIISLIFLLSLIHLFFKKQDFDKRVFRLVAGMIIIMMIAELFFTFYFSVFDIFNLLGHLFRIVAYYLIYLAVMEVGLMKPYRVFFKDLKASELRLKQERDKFLAIFDNMKDGVYITNKNNDIEYANPSLIKDFGPITLRQTKCYQYLHGRTAPCPWCRNEKIFAGETVRWEWYYVKNNKTYDIIDSPLRLPGGTSSKLEIFRDISEKKEMEKIKDEFISLAAHQLRTPLASISLSSELLLRGIAQGIPEKEQEYVEEIYRSTKRMSGLINNFLNVSRIEMGTFQIKPELINIKEYIEQVIKILIPLIEEKELILEQDLEDVPLVKFDENILGIIVENLLSNAIRYTPKGGKISIEMIKNGTHIVLKVADTGCGIPEEQKDKIFSKSFRADNAKELTSQGTGLGLYMIKLLAKKINLEIGFDSKINEGTTFYVGIPIEKIE